MDSEARTTSYYFFWIVRYNLISAIIVHLIVQVLYNNNLENILGKPEIIMFLVVNGITLILTVLELLVPQFPGTCIELTFKVVPFVLISFFCFITFFVYIFMDVASFLKLYIILMGTYMISASISHYFGSYKNDYEKIEDKHNGKTEEC